MRAAWCWQRVGARSRVGAKTHASRQWPGKLGVIFSIMYTYPRFIFVKNFEQRRIIFVIYRSLKTLQNAVEHLHNKSEKKRWQKNSNVICFIIYYGEHCLLGVAVVYLNPCTADSAHYAFVQTTLFCLRRLREAVVLRVKVCVFFNFIRV